MAQQVFRCSAVVLDIEGTTSSIAFVHDVLFPYARARMTEFIAKNLMDERIAGLLRDTAILVGERSASSLRLAQVLVGWLDEDRKVTPLKTLQGLIWADGYAAGDLRGHVYPDAVAGLKRWHAAGLKLYLYSSGSIAAQRLLFGQSIAGDLTFLFDGYFDTTSGPKDDVASYRRIARAMNAHVGDVLFASDREVELDAAAAAGWQTAALLRLTDVPLRTASKHQAFTTFDALNIERASIIREPCDAGSGVDSSGGHAQGPTK